MRKIVVGQYISLDGVVESPERWHMRYINDEMMAALGAGAAESDTMLLGRTTYDVFAGTFAGASDPVASMLNAQKKFVVTSSPDTLTWQNSEALSSADVVAEVTALKAGDGPAITTTGSLTLVRTLLRAGLVDELSLFVHPIVLGKGRRLFEDGGPAVTLELVSADVFRTGVIHQVYKVV